VNTLQLVHFGEVGLEQDFSAAEAFVSDGNFAAIRHFVVLFASLAVIGLLSGGVVVSNNITESLLNIADDFHLCGGGEFDVTLFEDLTQVVSEIATSQMDALDGVRDSETLINRDSV